MRRNLTIGLAAMFMVSLQWVSSAAAVTILAGARGNYAEAPVGQTTAAFNSGAGLSDTFGTGRWNYYKSDNANIDATINEALLDVGTPGAGTATGYGGGGSGADMPGVADDQLFNLPAPAANELALHPDDGSGVGSFIVLRWTAGAGEAGLVNIAGTVTNINDGNDGTAFRILFNGAAVYTAPIIGAGLASASFNFNQLIGVGDDIDFVLGNNGNYFNDETQLSATISIPEPSSLALLLCGAASVNWIWRKKRSR